MLTRLGNGLWRDAAAPAAEFGGRSRRRLRERLLQWSSGVWAPRAGSALRCEAREVVNAAGETPAAK